MLYISTHSHDQKEKPMLIIGKELHRPRRNHDYPLNRKTFLRRKKIKLRVMSNDGLP